MTDKRPVNLDISTIHFPVPAFVSIMHRISGIFLIAAFAAFLCFLQMSLSSPEGFTAAAEMLRQPGWKVAIWLVLAATIYHTCAGIKHLIMDMGIGETLEGGVKGAKLTLVISAAGILLAGWWVMSW